MVATKMFFITWFSSSTHLKIWKTSGLEDFQTTSRKSSRRSLLPCLPFITDLSVLVFNQMVLIFHLDMFFRSGFDIHVFRSGSDFGRLMESLHGSLLKYNALEDFQEVFQATSKKSSRRLQRSLPDDFQEVF
ncbi:hypothetical protein F2Q70_00018199 [Brassica cretica]|uniref:Uncharacterized protein n=1 Tax=Brassica cretica TaxID=69181 RepID=A0A8S9KZF4_BRACR|nr:hypothetical protein F2Q70_00018199 [Brassica cretica]KAF2600494.1 hypothetical protein F2Q68_00011339 [Brassica cretica]